MWISSATEKSFFSCCCCLLLAWLAVYYLREHLYILIIFLYLASWILLAAATDTTTFSLHHQFSSICCSQHIIWRPTNQRKYSSPFLSPASLSYPTAVDFFCCSFLFSVHIKLPVYSVHCLFCGSINILSITFFRQHLSDILDLVLETKGTSNHSSTEWSRWACY